MTILQGALVVEHYFELAMTDWYFAFAPDHTMFGGKSFGAIEAFFVSNEFEIRFRGSVVQHRPQTGV
jgi:hypothetical protein